MPLPDFETLLLDRRDGVDWLTLNRPDRLNAMNLVLIDELRGYFEALATDTSARVVVLHGAGRAFCAGVDIKDTSIGRLDDPHEGLRIQRRYSGVILAMRRCPQPIVALVHGAASGGGFSLALAADVRVAGQSARMNAAFIRIGFSGADMGSSYFLPRLVGLSNASELLMTGRFCDAERALRIGLVSEVVPDEELEAAGRLLADDMMATGPLGLRATKEALSVNIDSELDAAIALEDRHQVLCALGPDVREGMRAFLEKRRPQYGQG